MKKFILIFFLITISNVYSQTNASFFVEKTFQLEYFLKDGEREELDLMYTVSPGIDITREIPDIRFFLDEANALLEASIGGFCNGTSAKYLINNNYFEVLERGGTTLSDCGGDEETDFFIPITGNIYMQQPAKKVYYEITEDEKGLWLWSEENHKLFFSEKTLSIKENELEKAIAIYPNPSKEFVTINVISNTIEISNVSILDFQGRIIIEKRANFNKINISKLAKGIYFLKLKTDNNLSITKNLIVE